MFSKLQQPPRIHYPAIYLSLSLLQDDTLFTDEDDKFQCQVYELQKIIRGPKQSP